MASGYVYFVLQQQECRDCDLLGLTKIGYAKNPYSRLSELKTGNPHQLELVGMVKGTRLTEKRFHAALDHRRLNGEWFLLGDGWVVIHDLELAGDGYTANDVLQALDRNGYLPEGSGSLAGVRRA